MRSCIIKMDCLHCNRAINFEYHILRHGTQPNSIIGFGHFCSIECAKEKLKTKNHGDSDYFAALSLMLQKYVGENNVKIFYSPPEVTEIKSLLEVVEERPASIPKYQVKKAAKNKRSTNDILKNDFFTGKCETIYTAKNLCTSK